MSKINEVATERVLSMLETAFGPDVMQFLADDEIIEIMLNPCGSLWVERLYKGKSDTGLKINADQSTNIVKLVASVKNQIADDDLPVVSSEIPFEGARFQGWLPPVVESPCFAIRKRAKHIFTLDDYVASKSMTQTAADYLKNAVIEKQNIIIAGGTGSGKTTFANALIAELNDSSDRILVLEDLPELQIKARDVVFMNTTNTVSMRDLVKGSLRMRPDRIIIGEVRDGSALELLKAWNTGHPGGVCTLHANSCESTPYRLEDLIQEAVVTVPRALITQAVDIIVFLKRDANGRHLVESLVKIDKNQVITDSYVLINIS